MTFRALDALLDCYRRLGVRRLLSKQLAENDNSKQQIYLGGSFEVLKLLPLGSVRSEPGGKRPNFKASLPFNWIDSAGRTAPAPGAQLILYPDYPEVRLSGFLRGCAVTPAASMQPVAAGMRRHNNGTDGRTLFLGISDDRQVYAYVSDVGSEISNEFDARKSRGDFSEEGVLWNIPLGEVRNSRLVLLDRLRSIKEAGWHESMRLDRHGKRMAYVAQNGGGYTLEALLDIRPNGDAKPDFMGWELKAYSKDRITLMTPEPDTGFYGDEGVEAFVRKYGRDVGDDTLYFTGMHRANQACAATGQTLTLRGYNAEKGKLVDVKGGIELTAPDGTITAAWSFEGLIDHWARKHAAAAYVPYDRRGVVPPQYHYRDPVLLGERTEFSMYLDALNSGHVVYDPASKVTNASGRSKVKARSQFRISVKKLPMLYRNFETIML